MTRRLLCDMFDIPVFKDLLKTKIEMKLKELAVSFFFQFINYKKDFPGINSRKSPCCIHRSRQYISNYIKNRTNAMEYTGYMV
jgi:hypothetical protein